MNTSSSASFIIPTHIIYTEEKIQIFIAIFVEHIFSKDKEENGQMVGAGLLAPVQYLLYCLILKEFIYIHITTMTNPPPLTLLLIETNF